jgi:hypothetical protein
MIRSNVSPSLCGLYGRQGVGPRVAAKWIPPPFVIAKIKRCRGMMSVEWQQPFAGIILGTTPSV